MVRLEELNMDSSFCTTCHSRESFVQGAEVLDAWTLHWKESTVMRWTNRRRVDRRRAGNAVVYGMRGKKNMLIHEYDT